ncbi:MAG: acetate/propionate family kinase [Amphritea sp.]
MSLILTVNGGSSSLKCAVFSRHEEHEACLYRFKLGNILNDAKMTVYSGSGQKLEKHQLQLDNVGPEERHQACLDRVIHWVHTQLPDCRLSAFGHRVVHGGDTFSQPVIVTPMIMAQLKQLIPLAPLHQPYNLKLIEACQQLEPELPQIVCFDTMFHAGQPAVERHYAIPREFTEAGIQKYGFHGLSYEFIQQSLQALDQDCSDKNTIICHLGAGASMCAVKNGRSIASTMGFTAVDGLPMGSRCGNLDPGVLLYLQRHYHMDADQLERFLYKQSGWLGVSGISSDMLELHHSDKPEAEEAIAMFCYRAALEVGRLSAALQGLEQLVFTGGVGENDADVRQRICEQLRWMGIELDAAANDANNDVISHADSRITVRVIPTNEEAMIALHIEELLA